MKFLDALEFSVTFSEDLTREAYRIDDPGGSDGGRVHRRIMFEGHAEALRGVVIGSCFKFDGRIEQEVHYSDDHFPAFEGISNQFIPVRRYDMWIVAVDMNLTYRVPKYPERIPPERIRLEEEGGAVGGGWS